ncbi:MAG: MFS transporter [Bifidobacteriaceae bacterium]|jgi:EmrB/QacA subfamily drug resistance transporter|nr:MFS transporter [Bifidobacteriaceae bacterium]
MSHPKVSTRTKLSVLGTAGLAFCGVLVETSMNVTFPTLMKQFGTSLAAVQWVTTAYLLVVAATMVIAAFLEARFSFRTLAFWGGALFIVGDLICALSPSLPVLLTGRVIQGVSTGIAMPLLFGVIMQRIPFALQATYVGTGGMVVAFAPSLGPTYGGLVTQTLSWPMIFWFVLPVGIVMWLIALKTIEQPHPTQHIPFPLVQFLLVVIGLTTLLLGFNNISTQGFASVLSWGPFLVAIVCFVAFGLATSRSEHKLIDLKIFKISGFIKPLAIYFLVQFVQLGMNFLLPTYAQLVSHQSVSVSGLILLAGSLVSAILLPFVGRQLRPDNARTLFLIGSALLIISTVYFMVFTSSLSVIGMLLFYVSYMAGFAFIFNNALTFGLQQLDVRNIGDGNASFNTLQQYAGSLGTAIASVFVAMASGAGAYTGGSATQTVSQIITGTHNYFILGFVLCVVIAIISFTVKPSMKINEE